MSCLAGCKFTHLSWKKIELYLFLREYQFKKYMKRIMIVMAAAMFTLSLSAQGLPDFSKIEDYQVLHKEPTAKTSFDVLEYFGWGFHNVMGDAAFADNTGFGRNTEFFLNLFRFGVKPSPHHMFTLGVDLNWDSYRLNPNNCWAPYDLPTGSNAAEQFKATLMGAITYARDGHVAPVPFPGTVKKSLLRILSFDIPLDYTITFGKTICMTLGAAAEINLPGWTKFKGTANSDITGFTEDKLKGKDIKTNIVTYNAHVKLSVNDGFGIFAKYNPMPVLKEGYGPQFSTWTVGFFL